MIPIHGNPNRIAMDSHLDGMKKGEGVNSFIYFAVADTLGL
jgi:hypothetical protein